MADTVPLVVASTERKIKEGMMILGYIPKRKRPAYDNHGSAVMSPFHLVKEKPRLTDGVKHEVKVIKLTPEEMERLNER